MPLLDRTGPQGQGPQTGRQMGYQDIPPATAPEGAKITPEMIAWAIEILRLAGYDVSEAMPPPSAPAAGAPPTGTLQQALAERARG